MSTGIGSEDVVDDGRMVFEVKQVYIHIPAELSATKFELKISGVVRIIKKPEGTLLSWDPDELTYQDVAALYSTEADDWTLVDEDDVVSEQPRPLDCRPGGPYPTLPLDEVAPIVKTNASPREDTTSKQSKKGEERNKEKISTVKLPPLSSHPSPDSPVTFLLSDLKYVKENPVKPGRVQTLTFYLSDGKELPALHFYDGGTSGLLQALKRYVYFVRDGKDSRFLRVEESPFIVKANSDHMTTSHMVTRDDVFKGVEGLFSTAVLEVGKKVRHSFRTGKDMLEYRPKVSHDKSHDEEEIATITCQDIKTKGSGKGMTPDPDMSLITDFQVVSDLSSQLPPRPSQVPRLPPIEREEWESYRQIDGRITMEMEAEFRARVFAGGIEPSLRREVWKYLLGYFSFDATDIERMEVQKKRADQYEVMKRQWETLLPEQEAHWHKWRELKNLVEKDVIRTDRELEMYQSISSPRLKQLQSILNTYVMYNFDLGYVQGMSDFLAPILAVMDSEVDAFWCFVGLMEMVGHYFEETQTQMRMRMKRLRALLHVLDPKFYQFLKDRDSGTLYFAFRWLLIDFKREFNYDDTMCVWEVLWTHHLSSDYALFIALAILDQEKEKLMNESFDFSDVIAYINELSKKLDYEPLLLKAESICRQIAAVPELPEELDCLINRPLPEPHNFTNKPKS